MATGCVVEAICQLALKLQEQRLRFDGPSGLVVKVLAWIVRDVGLTPSWFHFSQQIRC